MYIRQSPFFLSPLPVARIQVELSDNSSSSEAVTLTEGDGTVEDFIRIYVSEPHSIPVQVSVSVSSDSAERGNIYS